jgi:hypothetical protein
MITPIFIDGEIGHFFTAYQADKDSVKTNVTNDFGRAAGWMPALRVPFWMMNDQDQTDRTVRDSFSGQWVSTTEGVITVEGGKITNEGSGYLFSPSGVVTQEPTRTWKTPEVIVEETTNTRIMRMMKYEEAGGFL